MNRDSKVIFENYKSVLKEQVDVPKTNIPELDDIISYVNSKPISDYSKQLIFNSLNHPLLITSFSKEAKQPNDADTVNMQPGDVSGPEAPSATGTKKPNPSTDPFRFEF